MCAAPYGGAQCHNFWNAIFATVDLNNKETLDTLDRIADILIGVRSIDTTVELATLGAIRKVLEVK